MCKILKITIPYVSQIAKKKLVDIIVDGILSLLPAFIDNIIGYRAVLRLPFGTFSLSELELSPSCTENTTVFSLIMPPS